MATPKQEQALKRMLKLTNALISRNDSIPFREPVDWRGLELWDYPKIVKKMMDLGTVKRKLERGVYQTHQEAAADIRLIWENCQLYNEEESDFFYLSKQFSKKFEDRYRKVLAECTLCNVLLFTCSSICIHYPSHMYTISHSDGSWRFHGGCSC
jgi:hypothetical protein